MPNERPVTGSCERCRRAHDLLIPEPGSGDLDLQRIGALFAWCAGCDRLVGLSCCWAGSAELCADCAVAVAAPSSAFTDATLTRDALAAIAGAAASLAAAEARLREMPIRDVDRARNAWEDAWLEAGAVVVRAEHAARVVRRRGSGNADMGRLAALGRTWRARRRTMEDRLERIGLRIHARSVEAMAAAAVPHDPPPAAIPVERMDLASSRRRVTTLTTPRAAVGRGRPVPAPMRSLEPVAVGSAVLARPARPAPAEARAPAPAAVLPAPRPRPAVATAPPIHYPEPDAAPHPRAATAADPQAWRQRARRHWLVVALVAVLTFLGAIVAGAMIAGQGGSADPSAPPTAGAGAQGGNDQVAGSPSTASPGAGGTDTSPPIGKLLTFDAEPLSTLAPDADGVARVLGAPEVAALPTSFDRSLRLGSAGDGICLAGPRDTAARVLTLDMHTGSQPAAAVRIVRRGDAVTVALAEIPGLAPNTWYRMRLAWQDDGSVTLDMRERRGGQGVHRAELPPAAAGGGYAGSACVAAESASDASAVHVDNVRIET